MQDPVIPADSYLLLLTSLYCRPVTIRETKRIKRNSPGHLAVADVSADIFLFDLRSDVGLLPLSTNQRSPFVFIHRLPLGV